ERERPRTLRWREVRVAGREREAFGVAHGGEDAHRRPQLEVADEPADHRRLLCVLLAEVHAPGADDREQLQADRGHAAEVARAVLPLERAPQLLHVAPGLA